MNNNDLTNALNGRGDVEGLDGKERVYMLLIGFGDHETDSPVFAEHGMERLPGKVWSIVCEKCKYSRLINGGQGGVEPCDVHTQQMIKNPLVQIVKMWAMTNKVWREARIREKSIEQNYPRDGGLLVLGDGI